MNEITPDFVARLASRIYSEVPMGAAESPTTVPSQVLPSQVVPPSLPVSPPTSLPTNLPANLPAYLPSHLPTNLPTPTLPVNAPVPVVPSTNISTPETPLRNAESVAVGGPPTDASLPGLKAFVAQVRTGGYLGRDSALSGPLHQWPRDPATRRAAQDSGPRPFDVNSIRADFPILRQTVHGRPLIWFDNAATTQKPRSVIDAISRFYERDNSNIHRGAHTLAARATDAFEGARDKVARFLGATSSKEIVFVRGTTEGVNLVVRTFGQKFVQSGDEIVLSVLEHHANIVPWQMLAKERGATLRVAPVNDAGEINLSEYERLLGPRTRVVALAHANNSLGTILPVQEMTQMAKRVGARVLIDGAQSVAHVPVDVKQLGADFYVFSGHKIFGPTGIGAVYMTEDLAADLPPWQGGGNMIRDVTFEETKFAEPPARFEAGTPNIADAVGLGAALDYVTRLGLPAIARYEHELLAYATQRLSSIPGLRLIGQAREKVGVLSFVLPHLSPEQVGKHLDREGIAVRAGHHCAQPSLRRFGLEATVRPSLSLYNTRDEVDYLCAALRRITRS